MSSNRNSLLLGAMLIIVATAAAYSSVAGFGFLFGDDERHIRDNIHVHAVNFRNLLWMFSSAEIDYWRPLSFLTNALDYAIWGDYIGGHHITSVAIHALAAIFVMGIAWVAFPMVFEPGSEHAHWRVFAALTAGVVFAVHPQHVETAAWLAERKGVLSSCFYFGAMWAYLNGRGEVLRWRIITSAFVLLAMLSKPLAVSLPLTLLVLDVYPLKRLTRHSSLAEWTRALVDKFAYVMIAVAVSLYTYLAVDVGGYINNTALLALDERLINAGRSVWLYISRFLAPIALVPIYPMVLVDNSVTALNLVAPIVVLITGAAGVWLWARGYPMVLGVTGLHLAMLGPVLGIVHLGAMSSADRYAYLPGGWMSVAAAFLLAAIGYRTAFKRALVLLTLVLSIALLMLTRQQVMVWSSDAAMFAVVNEYYPTWQRGIHYNRAMRAFNEGEYGKAASRFEAAIATEQMVARSHMFLAYSLEQLSHHQRARKHMLASLKLQPNSAFLLQMAVQFEVRQGNVESASALLARLAERVPGSPEIERQRALLKMQEGNMVGAERVLRALLRADPDDARNRVLLGVVAHQAGDVVTARKEYLEALRLDPANTDARQNLAQLPPE